MPPKTLVAPMHLHAREDEYSFVLEGRMAAKLGDDIVYANAGDFVFKPREQWHTFWNPDDTPCRILEIISPAGSEHFFASLRLSWPVNSTASSWRNSALPVDITSARERFGALRRARCEAPDGGRR